jgi:hypothetical protein
MDYLDSAVPILPLRAWRGMAKDDGGVSSGEHEQGRAATWLAATVAKQICGGEHDCPRVAGESYCAAHDQRVARGQVYMYHVDDFARVARAP